MILEDELFRRARVGGPEMGLEPALPVTVAQRRRAGGEEELARHEEVVRHRVRGDGEQAYPDQGGRGRREELGPRQCFFPRLSVRRPHSRSEMPRRTVRMVVATSSTVASTSSWTTSNTASSSASRASAASAA